MDCRASLAKTNRCYLLGYLWGYLLGKGRGNSENLQLNYEPLLSARSKTDNLISDKKLWITRNIKLKTVQNTAIEHSGDSQA